MSFLKSSVTYSQKEITNILLDNVLKMLENRGKIDPKNHKKNFNNLINQIKDELMFVLETKDFKVGIRIIKYKVSSLTRIDGINELLGDDTFDLKLVIFKEMNQKTFKQIIAFKNSQAFWEHELMINIIENNYVPQHQVLTDEERIDFVKSYQITRDKLPKLYLYDPISRYYNMKIGDVVRIYRPSPNSGVAITYRVVIDSPVQDLFS